MGKADYERVAAEVVGMPELRRLPAGQAPSDYLPLGRWAVADQPAAVEAIANRRLKRVRAMVAALAGRGLHAQAASAQAHDFLTFEEYRRAVAGIDAIRDRLAQIADQERRKAFDQKNRDGKTYFYPTYAYPPQNETAFAGIFDRRIHTPTIAGYMAYVGSVCPSLSRLFFLKLPALIPEKDRELHSYITGSSGAGKSELMKVLIHAAVMKSKPPCVVVIDPHGKFADEVARQREIVDSGRLIYLNPALSARRTPTINPFACNDPERAEYIGKGLMGLFELLFMQEKSAELSGNMRVLLNALLPALLRTPGADIMMLQKLLSADKEDKAFRQVLGCMETQQRDFIRADWGLKSFETTKESLRKKIQTIASTPFLRFVCGPNTFDLDAAVKKRSVICLSLSKSDLDSGTIKAMGAFFLATIQAYVYARAHERPEGDPNRVPIHVFVDECHNFVSPTFKEILTEARKFGLHLTLAQQFAGQGMDDAELKKAVLGNTGVKIAGFNNEAATQRVMAREMQLAEDDLIALEKHRFFVKTTDKPAFKLYPPGNLLGNRNAVNGETWRRVVADQLGRFYRPIEATDATGGRPPDGAAPEATADRTPSDFVAPPAADFR